MIKHSRLGQLADVAKEYLDPAGAGPRFTTDADGVLIAQQGDSHDAARNALHDEFRLQFPDEPA